MISMQTINRTKTLPSVLLLDQVKSRLQPDNWSPSNYIEVVGVRSEDEVLIAVPTTVGVEPDVHRVLAPLIPHLNKG